MRQLSIPTLILLGLAAQAAVARPSTVSIPLGGGQAGHAGVEGAALPRSERSANIGWTDARASSAATLPPPSVGEHAATHDYLTAARASLLAGRTGQAQQALEMAETHELDRSVPANQAMVVGGGLIARIREARHALGAGDNARALQLTDLALAN